MVTVDTALIRPGLFVVAPSAKRSWGRNSEIGMITVKLAINMITVNTIITHWTWTVKRTHYPRGPDIIASRTWHGASKYA